MEEHIKVADYFVLCTGTSRPHVRAIQAEIHARMKAAGRHHIRVEGDETGWWVLLDFGDVVVHILQPEAREHYRLDELYEDCPELAWREEPALAGE